MLVIAKKRYNFIVRGMVNTLLLNTCCRKKFDPAKTLVVMGATRSGTTWLSEIVNGIPDSCIVFEPISPTHVKEARLAGFTYDTFLGADDNWHKGYRLMDKILRGRLLTPWTTSQIPIHQGCKSQILIVKFVRANMLLGWLTHHFSIHPPALIIRHPCATVSSQLRKDWIPRLKTLLENPFFKGKTKLQEYCSRLKYPEEVLALRWCMRYFVPLSLQDRPFVLISYERLVRDGTAELQRLFSRWQIDLPVEAVARLKRPSKTVVSDSQIVKGDDPLLGWTKILTDEQVERIITVVSCFGMDFFSEAIEPDYERLYHQIPILQY